MDERLEAARESVSSREGGIATDRPLFQQAAYLAVLFLCFGMMAVAILAAGYYV